MYTKIGGVVKKPSSLLVNAAGTWKRVKEGSVKVAGVWRQFYYDWLAFKLTGTCTGASSNNYHYETFSQQAVTIAAGDILSFDIYTDSTARNVSLDFSFTGSTGVVGTGRSSSLKDQYGYNLDAAESANTVLAVNKWYTRTFSLTSIAGTSTLEWAGVLETDAAGTYTLWLRDVKITDANGVLKTRILGDTLPVTELKTFQSTTTAYYNTISKSMVQAPL